MTDDPGRQTKRWIKACPEFKAALHASRLKSLFASLSPQQQARVLAYDGPEDSGDPNGPKHTDANTRLHAARTTTQG